MDWCEARLCSLVEEPANTWSNLAYLSVALLLVRRKGQERIALLIYVMGLCSFVYHASNNYGSQWLDFVGMFLFTSYVISRDSRRLFFWIVFLFQNLLFFLFPLLGFPVQGIILLASLCILGLEMRSHRTNPRSGLWLLLSVFLFLVAAFFSYLDFQRIWCDPHNHWLQGHALWHLFSAAGIYGLMRSEEKTGSSMRVYPPIVAVRSPTAVSMPRGLSGQNAEGRSH